MSGPKPVLDEAQYAIVEARITSSNSIAKRASTIITHLQTVRIDNKVAVCAFQASGPAVNKLISIAEIAKRELSKAGIVAFQYTALSSKQVSAKPASANGKGHAGQQENEDESDAFEPIAGSEKLHTVPELTIYMSRSSVRVLKDAHGYVAIGDCEELLCSCQVVSNRLDTSLARDRLQPVPMHAWSAACTSTSEQRSRASSSSLAIRNLVQRKWQN